MKLFPPADDAFFLRSIVSTSGRIVKKMNEGILRISPIVILKLDLCTLATAEKKANAGHTKRDEACGNRLGCKK